MVPGTMLIYAGRQTVSLVIPSPPATAAVSMFLSTTSTTVSVTYPTLSMCAVSRMCVSLSVFSSDELEADSLLYMPRVKLAVGVVFFLFSLVRINSVVCVL